MGICIENSRELAAMYTYSSNSPGTPTRIPARFARTASVSVAETVHRRLEDLRPGWSIVVSCPQTSGHTYFLMALLKLYTTYTENCGQKRQQIFWLRRCSSFQLKWLSYFYHNCIRLEQHIPYRWSGVCYYTMCMCQKIRNNRRTSDRAIDRSPIRTFHKRIQP